MRGARSSVIAVAAMASCCLLADVPGAWAGDGPYTEERCNREIQQYVQTIHGLQMTASSGGPLILLSGLLEGLQKNAISWQFLLHSKVESAGGCRGDAAIAAKSEKSFRGSFIFRVSEALPQRSVQANKLFERVLGRAARGGILGMRTFARDEKGNWFLAGDYANHEEGSVVSVLGTIAVDEDDPSHLVVALFSEVGPTRGR